MGASGAERLVDRALAAGKLHHRKQHIAFGRMRLLHDTIGDAAKNLIHVGRRMRRESNLHFRHEIRLRAKGLSGEIRVEECRGRRFARGLVAL